MLTLDVKEFGPIAEGSVTLRPLTIFVGPNNTGKSYLAMLAYAMMRSLPRGMALWDTRQYALSTEWILR
ncbi:MAG TPA: hypothetical protein VML19_27510, partial [Verrucomicrobiae bacterium]|nr:hypothetical protein [Verrucomicrobiae bacterium]